MKQQEQLDTENLELAELDLITNLARQYVPDNGLVMKDYLRKERINTSVRLKYKNALKRILVALSIIAALALIYSVAESNPVVDTLPGADTMISKDLAEYMRTTGHGEILTIYVVE